MIMKDKARITYLDGIRGVAAFLVIFGHFKNAFFDNQINNRVSAGFWYLFDHFFLSASFCVEIFFVLSGFVLAYNIVNRPAFLKKQWLKRFYRLFVPVLLTSLLYFIFSRYGLIYFRQLEGVHINEWISQQWATDNTFLQFLIGCFYELLIMSNFHFMLSINSALWTIPIEIYWSYLLFFTFFLAGFMKGKLLQHIFIAVIMLGVVRFATFKGAIYGVLFMAGALMASNYVWLRSVFTKPLKIILVLSVVAFTITTDHNWLPETIRIPFHWSYLVATLLVLLAVVSDKVQRIFQIRFIQWIGRISFGLYLLHMIVIGSLSAWLYVQVPALRADAGLFALLLLTITVSLLIAHLFTKYVDEPLMALYDKVYKRFAKPVWVAK